MLDLDSSDELYAMLAEYVAEFAILPGEEHAIERFLEFVDETIDSRPRN